MDEGDGKATRSVARIETVQAARYLTQLCKHFEHRLKVEYDAQVGSIEFAGGVARLQAEAGVLQLEVEATEPAGLPQLEDVVARHLVRFAFREELQIVWHAGGD